MPLLRPRLNLKVSQRQILTPGLMQMVSVLALNKLELTEMIDAEMVENPVLEEIDETVPTLDEVGGRLERKEREERLEHLEPGPSEPPPSKNDPFNEIDFGSYFQDYLDPGFRTQPEYEENDRPSFENFLSQPTTLSDHLAWQLGSLTLDPRLDMVAEFIIGNLDEDGYLTVSPEELADAFAQFPENGDLVNGAVLDLVKRGIEQVQQLDPAGVAARDLRECLQIQIAAQRREFEQVFARHAAEVDTDEDEEEDVDDSFSTEADAKLEERRR